MRSTLVRTTAAVIVACAFLGITSWTRAQEGGEHSFVDSKSCKKCHIATFKSWEETSHAKTFALLKPGERAEAKTKAGLDPAMDYTKDEKCLRCHTTGFGHPGGYAIPDASDPKAVRAAGNLEGVGCESCHGAGDKYSEVFKEIMQSKRKYKVAELHAVGLKPVTAETCTQCHNQESPTFKPFDFEKGKETNVHTHEALEQREG